MVNLMGYSVLVDNEEQAKKLQELAFEQGFEWKYGDEKIKNLDERSFQFGYGDEKIITISMSRRHYQDKHITKKAHFNDLFGAKFTPIAMRCTQEQFDAIKPKLNNKKSLNIFMFNKEWNSFYLALFEDGSITNGLTHSGNGEIHEEWNEELFLKACGIEDDTLEQQLEKAKAEVERLEKAIEEKNKIKVGDWVKDTNNVIFKCRRITTASPTWVKITNPQLIILLENESKN